MQRVKVDFTKRDEKDRLPVPPGLGLKHGDRVVIYDEDLEAQGYMVVARGGRRFLQINWAPLKISSWKADPPPAVQEELSQYPMSIRQEWPDLY